MPHISTIFNLTIVKQSFIRIIKVNFLVSKDRKMRQIGPDAYIVPTVAAILTIVITSRVNDTKWHVTV